jgi:hypothetical protein
MNKQKKYAVGEYDVFLREAIMLELRVYCHDALRYTVIGDWNKVQELQGQGYYVDVKLAIRRGLEMDDRKDHSPADTEKYNQAYNS